MQPRYRLPFSAVFSLAVHMIMGEGHDIRPFANKMILGIEPPVHIIGSENIPKQGPFLLTFNHYHREGFSIIWAAACISSQMPQAPHWVMTNAWRYPHGLMGKVREKRTRFVFTRFANYFDFLSMPPMPPKPAETVERALAIRKLFDLLAENPRTILCLAPEGQDQVDGLLGTPHPGTGKLIFRICKRLQQVLPVGVFEKDGRFTIHFGKPFELISKKPNDEEVIREVMQAISQYLPENLIAAQDFSKEEK